MPTKAFFHTEQYFRALKQIDLDQFKHNFDSLKTVDTRI